MKKTSLLWIGWALSNSLLLSAEWTTFRGADRSAVQHETGLLQRLPENGPKQLWLFEDAGLGYSGFAVKNGVMYTLGASDDFEEFVVAVDATSGKELWRTIVGARYTNRWGDGPRSTPTLDGNLLYALGARGDLVCLDLKTGKKVWSTHLIDEHGGVLQGWGYTESPLVDGDKVIVTPGGIKGTVLALDKKTGAKLWQTGEWQDVAQYASALAVDHRGQRQIIQRSMTQVAGIDPASGKVLWQQSFSTGKTAVIPTAVYHEGRVYVTAGYGAGCMMFEIGDNQPRVIYQNTEMSNHHGGVLLVNGHIYGHSDRNGWTCQNFNTGAVVWQNKDLGKGAIHCAGGRLYLLEESSGQVVMIEPTPEGWQEQGRMRLEAQSDQRSRDGRIWTHPVVADGRLYLRDQELISCFDVKAK